MELGDLRGQVGESTENLLSVRASDQGVDLIAQEMDVLRQRVDLLEGAVVQVEAQPDEQPLVRRSQRLPRSSHAWDRLGRLALECRDGGGTICVPSGLRTARDAELPIEVA